MTFQRERERALLGPVDPFSILQPRRFFWCKLSRMALEGEWARPIPEPLGTIFNEPVASLSFQDHVTTWLWGREWARPKNYRFLFFLRMLELASK